MSDRNSLPADSYRQFPLNRQHLRTMQFGPVLILTLRRQKKKFELCCLSVKSTPKKKKKTCSIPSFCKLLQSSKIERLFLSLPTTNAQNRIAFHYVVFLGSFSSHLLECVLRGQHTRECYISALFRQQTGTVLLLPAWPLFSVVCALRWYLDGFLPSASTKRHFCYNGP